MLSGLLGLLEDGFRHAVGPAYENTRMLIKPRPQSRVRPT